MEAQQDLWKSKLKISPLAEELWNFNFNLETDTPLSEVLWNINKSKSLQKRRNKTYYENLPWLIYG